MNSKASSTGSLKEVTKDNPCVICGRDHHCSTLSDSLLLCKKAEYNSKLPSGYKWTKDHDSEGTYYIGTKESQRKWWEQNRKGYKKPDHVYEYPIYERNATEEDGIETDLGLLKRSNKTLVVSRWDNPKDIKQWTKDGNKPEYKKNLPKDSIVGLYSNYPFDDVVEGGKLRRVCKAVIFVEGEKNADVFSKFDDNLKNYFAVTNPGGAGKITKEQIKLSIPALKNSNVPIILSPDNDKPGFNHMKLIYDLLTSEGISKDRIRVVDFNKALDKTFDSVPLKFDMADYVDRFGWVFQTVDDFLDHLTITTDEFPWDKFKEESKEASKGRYLFESWMDSRESLGNDLDAEWLVEGLLVKGSSTVLTAKPKVGKTVLTLDLLASVYTEQSFLGKVTKQAKVLYLNNDQPKKGFLFQVQNRWESIGNGLIVCQGWKADEEGIEQLEEWAKTNPGSLIVLDSIRACICQPLNISQNDEGTGYKMKEIIDKISPYECSIIFIHHDSKNRENTGTHRASGHTSITSMVDNTWHLNKDANGNRKLSVLGTRLGDELEITYTLDDYQCVALESDKEDFEEESKKELSLEELITEYLETQGKDFSTAKEIAEVIGKTQQSVKRVLDKMELDKRKIGQATGYRLKQ